MATLKDTPVDHTVTIQSFTDDQTCEAIVGNGFTIGSDVTVISKLPGALTCDINHSRFAIRASDAANIIVTD